MAYIVDGNNVMGQRPGWHRDKSQARRRLLKEVVAFARVRKARITIVFDGAPDPLLPDGSAHRGVRVLYAEKGSDADTRIERMVESSPDPRGLTVVTSDRRLATTVRWRGASVERSGEFRRKIEEAARSAPEAEDGEHFEAGDIEGWMRYFGETMSDE